MDFTSIKDMDLKGKIVLLRADLNVPAQNARVTDTTRIDRLKPTISYLTEAGARVLVLSHFGRPEGEQNPQMSLAFLVSALQESWGVPVKFAPDCVGDPAQKVASSLQDGQVALLENLRFHEGEESNDPDFIAELAALGDVYVNDAFSAAHRAHASTEGLAHALPAAAGLLMGEELTALSRALDAPEKPVMAIAGGSKISTKLSVLLNLVKKVDYLVLGGGMANTFLYAKGAEIGGSLCEKDMTDEAKNIIKAAEKSGCEIVLPVDAVCVEEIAPDAAFEVYDTQNIPADKRAIDAGPASVELFAEKLKFCKTLVWNGPLGVFEIKPFDAGTNKLAEVAASLTKEGKLVSVAGGGDTVAALENAGVRHDFTYISTAGGAFLEWLEGKELPGVTALSSQSKAA